MSEESLPQRQILIGDEWTFVPEGYIRQEAEYCRKEYEAFIMCPEGHPNRENLRNQVLDKRVEFYKHYWLQNNNNTGSISEDVYQPEGRH